MRRNITELRGPGPPDSAATVPALKEWSAVVHALLDGRQTVLLRKGGIHEKRFDVAADEFVLFPTVAHSHAPRVRPVHRNLVAAAAADSTDDRVVIRSAANTVAAVQVNRPERLQEIEDLHIWTADSVREDRLEFRPKHRLTVLIVQAIPLLPPVSLNRAPEYAGCTSWVQVPVRAALGSPIHDNVTLSRVADRVRDTVG